MATRKVIDRKGKKSPITHIGIDEVGRGPLAGPMVLAAVGGIVPQLLKGIRDSKKLSPKKREEWYQVIKKSATCHIAVVPAQDIDTVGISKTARDAVARLVLAFQIPRAKVLLDGGLYAPREYRQETIIKGDEKIPLIAAASIIAKVTRDRMMIRFARTYPQYGFEAHKGYGTAVHRAAIEKYGLSKIHRKTFCTRFITSK